MGNLAKAKQIYTEKANEYVVFGSHKKKYKGNSMVARHQN